MHKWNFTDINFKVYMHCTSEDSANKHEDKIENEKKKKRKKEKSVCVTVLWLKKACRLLSKVQSKNFIFSSHLLSVNVW